MEIKQGSYPADELDAVLRKTLDLAQGQGQAAAGFACLGYGKVESFLTTLDFGFVADAFLDAGAKSRTAWLKKSFNRI
jgi:hypothetical protein